MSIDLDTALNHGDGARQEATRRVYSAASEPNDKGNMNIVAKRLRGKYIVADGIKRYDEFGRYRDDVPPTFQSVAHKVVHDELVARETEAYTLLDPELPEDEHKKLAKAYSTIRAWRIKSGMSGHMEYLPKHAAKEPTFMRDPAALDPREPLLNARNVVVNLAPGHVGEALDHSPDYLFTKVAGCEYHPEAECPNFMAALEYALPEVEREFLKRYCGQALLPERSEKLLVAVGPSRAGKTTIQRAPIEVMGDFALVANPDLLSLKSNKNGEDASPFLADLAGMRFVAMDEVGRDSRMAESILKRITGTRIRVRKLYTNGFYVDLQASYMLSTNFMFDVDGSDDAVFERLFVLRFDNVIPEQDRDVRWFEKNVVEADELPGVLNWMLAGLHDYYEQGFNAPESVRVATREYQQEFDVIGQWIAQCTRPAPDGAMKSTPAFRNSFVKFRTMRGGRHVNEKEWRDRILALDYVGDKTEKIRFADGDRCMAFTGIEMDDSNVYDDDEPSI